MAKKERGWVARWWRVEGEREGLMLLQYSSISPRQEAAIWFFSKFVSKRDSEEGEEEGGVPR